MDDSVDNSLNLIKLCVGAETVQDLLDWQGSARAKGPDGLPRHVTRMWPKREEALLQGGSLFWVIKGVIQCRQAILRLEPVDHGDGIRRCGIVLNPKVIRVDATPKRAFQGWRYLEGRVAPRDVAKGSANDDLPPKLMAALAEIGLR